MNTLRSSLVVLALAAGLVRPAAAQDADPHAADVASVDALITALYEAISGPEGAPRDWERFSYLVHPEARLIPTRCGADGTCTAQILTPEGYREMANDFLVREGFVERELHRRTERYGAVTHAFSSYESYRRGQTEPFARGINSIQLFWDGERWWVMNIFWDSERPNNPLPEDMQGAG